MKKEKVKEEKELDVVVEAELSVEDLQKKLEEVENKYLLLYADFENYKKRAIKEKQDIVSSTKVNTLSSILDIDNDISIAIKSIQDESTKEGVQLIYNKLQNFLESQGIQAIQTQTYDEELHEVISVLETGESKIVDVISKGYTIYGKPFRYPKIVLSK